MKRRRALRERNLPRNSQPETHPDDGWGSQEVIETLSDAMLWRGIPEHIRSDNGAEFIAQTAARVVGETREDATTEKNS